MRDIVRLILGIVVVILLLILTRNTWGLTDAVGELRNEVVSISDAYARENGAARAATARIEEGRLLLNAGQLDSAKVALLSALERDPSSIEAHDLLEAVIVQGVIREPDRYVGDADKAQYFATRFQVAPTANVSASDASVALGNVALFAGNDVLRAKAYFDQAAAAQADNLNALVGQALVSLNDDPKAPKIDVPTLVGAIGDTDASPLACQTIAKVALASPSPDLKTALVFAERAIGLRRSPQNLELLARIYLQSGDMVKAKETATELSMQAPRTPTGFQILCRLALKPGKAGAEAIAPCSAAFQRSNELSDQIAMARALAAGGRDREAAEAYSEVLRRDDQQVAVYLEFSDVLQRLGDLRGASAALSQVANIEAPPDTTLPIEISKLRDAARQKLSAIGAVPAASQAAQPGPGKGR